MVLHICNICMLCINSFWFDSSNSWKISHSVKKYVWEWIKTVKLWAVKLKQWSERLKYCHYKQPLYKYIKYWFFFLLSLFKTVKGLCRVACSITPIWVLEHVAFVKGKPLLTSSPPSSWEPVANNWEMTGSCLVFGSLKCLCPVIQKKTNTQHVPLYSDRGKDRAEWQRK